MLGAGQAVVEQHVGFPMKMAAEGNQRRSGGGCNPVQKPGPISMDHILLALHETKEEREVRIRSLFNFFNAAGLGHLDYAQIEAGLSVLRIPTEYKYARDLLKVCDANRDGQVNYQEFRRYMDDKELELYRLFQAIDVEHNGCIFPEELWDALVRTVHSLGTDDFLPLESYGLDPSDFITETSPRLRRRRRGSSNVGDPSWEKSPSSLFLP